MKTLVALSMAVIFAGTGLTVRSVAAADLKVGDVAPDFTLPGTDGKTYKLSDFQGKQVVVVAWYPKAFTGGCTKECTSFAQKGDLIRAYDVAYFTASCDTADYNKKFAESLNADYPILSDPTRSTAQAYGLVAKPTENAKRVTFYIGKDGKIAAIDTMVDTTNAAEEVAKTLGDLGVAKKK